MVFGFLELLLLAGAGCVGLAGGWKAPAGLSCISFAVPESRCLRLLGLFMSVLQT